MALGAVLGAIGVALGALGAHALKRWLEADQLTTFDTGARYHLVHAVMVVVAASRSTRAAWAFVAGIALFSGSLYGLALTRIAAFGPITPLGGAAFIAGWLLLAHDALRNRGRG